MKKNKKMAAISFILLATFSFVFGQSDSYFHPLKASDQDKIISHLCVVNQGRIYIGNNDNDMGNDYPPVYWSFYLNPHFCDLDISALMDMTWKGTK